MIFWNYSNWCRNVCIPTRSNLGRSGNPTWLAGNPTKSLARNPTSNCGKWEVQKKPRGDWVYNVGSCVTCFLESLRYNSIRNLVNTNKTPGSKPPVSQRWQISSNLGSSTPGGKFSWQHLLHVSPGRPPWHIKVPWKVQTLQGPHRAFLVAGEWCRWWVQNSGETTLGCLKLYIINSGRSDYGTNHCV